MHKLAKVILFIIVALILAIGATIAFICYETSDEQLRKNTETYLSEALGTEVTLKGAKLKPLRRQIAIYGFNIKDRKNIDMLHVDTLEAELDFWELWHSRVLVYGFNLSGANAILYKERKDTATNYQFVVDALKFSGNDKDKNSKKEKKNKKEIYIDLHRVTVSHTSARWDIHSEDSLNTASHKEIDPNHLWVHDLNLNLSFHGGGAPGTFVGTLKRLAVDEHNSGTRISIENLAFNGKEHTTEIGNIDFRYQDKHLTVSDLKLTGDVMQRKDKHHLTIKDIAFENGIGVPKKPRSPKKGVFDAKHVKVNMSLDATATCLTTDSIAMQVDKFSGIEHNSGLKIDNLTMSMTRNRNRSMLGKIHLVSGSNNLNIENICVNLPRYGKNARPLSFTIQSLRGSVMLNEIAHAFAPPLANFTTPLTVKTSVKGDTKNIHLRDIVVKTPDHRLQIAASGIFNLPQHKGEKISMSFDINSLRATGGIKDQIIMHFLKKPNAMKFIRSFGDISFRGKVTIPWHRQIIQGMLSTRYGTFDVNTTLTTDNAYLTGNLKTDGFRLGEFLDNKNLGNVALQADVQMDISSKKKAKLLHRKKGKIPAGSIKGRAIEASYKGIKIKDVDFSIVSNAESANGTLSATGKVMDVSCDFSFDDADIKHSLKVKPHIKMHNIFENAAPVKFFKKLFGKKKKKEK